MNKLSCIPPTHPLSYNVTQPGDKNINIINQSGGIVNLGDSPTSHTYLKKISPFYTSSLLTPPLIEFLNKDGSVIDLDESPSMFSMHQENKECQTYYKKTTDFTFQSIYNTNLERQIQVSASIDKINIIGKTSKANWKSVSFMQNIIQAKSHRCTSVFKVLTFEDICIVQFLMIGESFL